MEVTEEVLKGSAFHILRAAPTELTGLPMVDSCLGAPSSQVGGKCAIKQLLGALIISEKVLT